MLVPRWGRSRQCPGAVISKEYASLHQLQRRTPPCSRGIRSLWCCLLFLPAFGYMLWFISGRKCTRGDACNQSGRAFERGKSNSGSFMKKRWLSCVAIKCCVHSPAQNYFWFLFKHSKSSGSPFTGNQIADNRDLPQQEKAQAFIYKELILPSKGEHQTQWQTPFPFLNDC